jgi:glycosyltransferase involved in cell wall biosynthesis
LPAESLTVCFLNSTRKWGGVKTWTLDFGEALQERGYRIVAAVRPGTPFVEACRAQGFTVYPLRYGPKYNPVAVLRLVRMLRRERPAVAVVNISKDLNVGAVAAKLCGIAVLRRVGLEEDYRGTREERLLHRMVVDHVLVPSHFLKAGLRRRLEWMRPEAISVIPNSKQLARYRPPQRCAEGPVVFGVSSQLSPSKGHTYLLQALGALREQGLRVELRVAGTGPLESALQGEAVDRGVAEAVTFCGFRRDIPAFLERIDVYVLPSLKEDFPNAMLEAMCASLPVVAFDVGGVPEMLGDAGILTPPAEISPLVEAMKRLIRDPGLRVELGRAARRRAEEKFDLDVNAGALERLLRELACR